MLGEISVEGKKVLVIDDYAHHPREINSTLTAVRNGWPGHRIVAVFQPHRYTRTRDLFEDFTRVLSAADVLLLLDLYPAGELPIAGADSRSLCRAIRLRGSVDPIFVENKDEINAMISGIVEDNDILIVLGAGDVGSVAPALMRQYGKELN